MFLYFSDFCFGQSKKTLTYFNRHPWHLFEMGAYFKEKGSAYFSKRESSHFSGAPIRDWLINMTKTVIKYKRDVKTMQI